MRLAEDVQDVTVITVSVDYADLLDLTLPSRMEWSDRIIVATSPQDMTTQSVCRKYGVDCYITDAFYRYGAIFNKGLVIEKLFHRTGRRGWYLVLDADIVLDNFPELDTLPVDCLYSCRRRQLTDFRRLPEYPPSRWHELAYCPDPELPGCFHLFHSNAPTCRSVPWYGVRWKHAAGCDSEFERKWPRDKKVWLPIDILHLGPHGANWCGRVMDFLDGSRPDKADQAAQRMDELRMMRARSAVRYAGEFVEAEVDIEGD